MPFITFEGLDGSGKSTLIKLLAESLQSQGKSVFLTREPGGSSLGPELRSILLRTKGPAPCPEAELLIYEADRAQHVLEIIQPRVAQGEWVLSDRFADSSLIFQGEGRGLNKDDIRWLNAFATKGTQPDVTFLLDCPVELSFSRRAKRKADRFEQEEQAFHERVRKGFLDLARSEKKRFVILDATQEPEELLKHVQDKLQTRGLL